jgi:hypothetical protein
MELGLSLSLSRLGGIPSSFSPLDLGVDLLGWWDASTLADGAVASWADVVAGYTVTQATSGARPVKSATSFGGAPGVTFDGIDDRLTLESVPFPINADPCEIWVVTQQNALAADTGARTAFSYGAAGGTTRAVSRVVDGGVNRGRSSAGDGGFISVVEPTVDFSGRCVLRGIVTGTQLNTQVNNALAAPANVTPTTANTRVRMGSSSTTTASTFWHGIHRHVIVVSGSLTADQKTQLQTWAMAQRMI